MKQLARATMNKPTPQTYGTLTTAYDFFNKRLFGGKLPPCLVTLQRHANAYGYFAGGRFGEKDGKRVHDEIALNPSHFKDRTTEQSLSTLAHEMAHLWQHHFGTPGRTSYHNKEWAAKMIEIGLIPSDTGQPGGRQVGQKVSHYIEAGGRFQRAFAELEAKGLPPFYVELWSEAEASKAKTKAASKTRYTCPSCGLNAWAKPQVSIICGKCEEPMEAED